MLSTTGTMSDMRLQHLLTFETLKKVEFYGKQKAGFTLSFFLTVDLQTIKLEKDNYRVA